MLDAKDDPVALRDLRRSVALIAFVVVLSLVTLGVQGNWPKMIRVSASFTVYAAVLLALAKSDLPRRGSQSPDRCRAVGSV